VTAARRTWVDDRRDAFARRVLAISGGTAGELDYEPSVGFAAREGIPPAIEEIAAAFEEELERSAEREMRRGMTLVGPHRDDLRLRAQREGSPDQWVDLRTYGSGGQQRTAAVALRMVEAETLRESLGSSPIILLDDVFAELDSGRSRRILSWIEAEEEGQVILTAPKPADFELRDGELPLWRIEAGVVHPL
jgi:DNA replication and repair protein RecF